MALPWLESLPAFAEATAPAAFPKRFAVLFMGNGVNEDHWGFDDGSTVRWLLMKGPRTAVSSHPEAPGFLQPAANLSPLSPRVARFFPKVHRQALQPAQAEDLRRIRA